MTDTVLDLEVRLVTPAALTEFCTSVLRHHNVPGPDALLVADTLVQADLWGHQSHGVLRLPWYVERIRRGAMSAVTAPETIVDTGAMLLLDGRDGIGQVLAETASIEAVGRARVHGVGAVAVRNSNHFGTAMYFTRRMARSAAPSFRWPATRATPWRS